MCPSPLKWWIKNIRTPLKNVGQKNMCPPPYGCSPLPAPGITKLPLPCFSIHILVSGTMGLYAMKMKIFSTSEMWFRVCDVNGSRKQLSLFPKLLRKGLASYSTPICWSDWYESNSCKNMYSNSSFLYYLAIFQKMLTM